MTYITSIWILVKRVGRPCWYVAGSCTTCWGAWWRASHWSSDFSVMQHLIWWLITVSGSPSRAVTTANLLIPTLYLTKNILNPNGLVIQTLSNQTKYKFKANAHFCSSARQQIQSGPWEQVDGLRNIELIPIKVVDVNNWVGKWDNLGQEWRTKARMNMSINERMRVRNWCQMAPKNRTGG